MVSEIAQRSPAQQLVAAIRSDDFKQQAQLALPEGVSVDRFTRSTVTALMANPELAQQASHDTIFTAILRSAQAGLVPDGKEAAIVVFNGKAQFMEMIGGARKIAGEHGWALDTGVVKQADEFEYEHGLEPKVRHVIRPGVDRGATIAAYCIARHTSGQKLVEVMMLAELEEIRKTSKKPTSGPWKDWTDRMYEKTVGKRAFAKLPLGDLDQRVLRIREATDTPPDEATRVIYGTVIEETPAQLPAGTDTNHAEGMTASPASEPGRVGAEQQAAAAAPPVAAAPASPEPEPSLADDPEPVQTSFEAPASAGVDDDPTVAAARAASQYLIPNGDHQGLSLAELQEKGEKGTPWLRWALKNITEPADYREAIWAYSRVYAPELYQAALAAAEVAA